MASSATGQYSAFGNTSVSTASVAPTSHQATARPRGGSGMDDDIVDADFEDLDDSKRAS